MDQVRSLLQAGHAASAVAEATGVPIATVGRWSRGATRAFGARVDPAPWRPADAATYAYLPGLYLGDGHVYVDRRGRALLRVHLDSAYPGIVAECRSAVAAVSGRAVQVLGRAGVRIAIVQSQWRRWPDAFPQHGPGRKHQRPIVLDDWQREAVDLHPDRFVRGLVHSDGCRTVNRFRTTLPSGRVAEYAYPRYFFSKELERHPRPLLRRVRPARRALVAAERAQHLGRAPPERRGARPRRRAEGLTA